MKSFLDSIRARFNTAKATLEKSGDELQRLESEAANAKAAFDKFGSTQNGSELRSEAHRIWTEAQQALDRYRENFKQAERIAKDCKPLLTARTDLDSAHHEYTQSKALETTAISEISNLEKLIAELHSELSELSTKAKHALAAHGVLAVSARLIGQPTPQTPKSVLALNVDIESRNATLESAESMLEDAQKRRADATKFAEQWRNQWEYARHCIAEIEYRDLLAAIAPKVSTYLASHVHFYPTEIKFAPEPEALAAARELLRAELEQAPR